MASPKINATHYAVLAQAQRDCDELGRMRTSSELYGRNTRARDRMLSSLRHMEAIGLVERDGYEWSTGRVTPAGLHLLATTAAPIRRPVGFRPDRGIAPDGGTIFKKALVEVGQAPILAKGIQSAKLGRVVTKGRHKGLPMHYVTLEEGKTCPLSCAMRSRCYGGNMPLAKRIVWRGEKTGEAIAGAIAREPPRMIRMHNLGDFPSRSYVRNVLAALYTAGSAAFGFTHWPPGSVLGYMLRQFSSEHWDIFAIRTSYLHGTREPLPERAAVIVEHPDQAKEHNAIVCPEQMGQVSSCAECGYCWNTKRNVAFVLHENLARMKREQPMQEAA